MCGLNVGDGGPGRSSGIGISSLISSKVDANCGENDSKDELVRNLVGLSSAVKGGGSGIGELGGGSIGSSILNLS